MKFSLIKILPVLWLSACATGSVSLPEHPSQLQYQERTIEFPKPADYRHTLVGGNIAYVVEDRSLPLIQMTMISPAGAYLLDSSQAGIAGMTATMLRDGGTRDLSPADLDERLDFLASSVGFSIGSTRSSGSLNSLSGNFDESLDLMFDMLTEPGFDAERLEINVQRSIEQMRKRNDDTRSIEPVVWADLLLGDSFFANRQATQANIEAITPQGMELIVRQMFGSGNLIFAISGDIDSATAVKAINAQLARLGTAGDLPEIPSTPVAAAAGLYGVSKDDVNQTRVTIGHPGPRIHHPDEYAIAVMNDILGGGGFTSRITSRVRSDEGLAYSAGSRFSLGRHYPVLFRAFFQSKNASVPQALAIVMEEIERIRMAPVSDQELSTAIESQVAFLADLHSSAAKMASRFATDEFNDEDPAYWRNYEASIRSITAADVQKAAEEHLDPEKLRILVVGKLDEAQAGDGEHGTLEEIAGKAMTRIPLKDPLTLEPLE